MMAAAPSSSLKLLLQEQKLLFPPFKGLNSSWRWNPLNMINRYRAKLDLYTSLNFFNLLLINLPHLWSIFNYFAVMDPVPSGNVGSKIYSALLNTIMTVTIEMLNGGWYYKAESCSRSVLLPNWAVGQGWDLAGHRQIHASHVGSHEPQSSGSFFGKNWELASKSGLKCYGRSHCKM